MKKLVVRKVLKYDPTLNRTYSLYAGYLKSALQQSDPEITEFIVPELPISPDIIFSSPLRRAQETAEIFQKKYKVKEVILLKELGEVQFDLAKLVSESEFIQKGSKVVRERFIESFIDNTLEETRVQIKQRLRKVITMFELSAHSCYLVVSHSFLMKIVEIYLEYPDLFENPSRLKDQFDSSKKTYPFGGGFSFEIADNNN